MPAPQASAAFLGPNHFSAASAERNAADAIAQPAPWLMTHAVLASALAIVSRTVACVTRSSSSPPSDFGSSRRNRRASCNASSTSSGSSRAASMRGAASSSSDTTLCARATASEVLGPGVRVLHWLLPRCRSELPITASLRCGLAMLQGLPDLTPVVMRQGSPGTMICQLIRPAAVDAAGGDEGVIVDRA